MVATEISGAWAPATEIVAPADAAANTNAYLLGISCTSVGNCTASGFYQDNSGNSQAMVATESSGTWAPASEIVAPANAAADPLANLWGISCPSVGNCTAVGDYSVSPGGAGLYRAMGVTEISGTWAPATEVTAPANAENTDTDLGGISCSLAGNCTAAGQYVDSSGNSQAMVVTEMSGTWAPATEVTAPANAAADPLAYLPGISCPSVGDCTASGLYSDSAGNRQAMVATETSGTWAPATEVTSPANAAANPLAWLQGISCPSVGNCTAAGFYFDSSGTTRAMGVTEISGTWALATEVTAPANSDATPNGYFEGISCPSVGNCTASGGYDDSSGNGQAMVASQIGAPHGPVVTGVTPDFGRARSVVTIEGLGFNTSPNTMEIDFGPKPGRNVVCTSSAMCRATVPPGIPHNTTVDVIAVDNSCAPTSCFSAVNPSDHFTDSPGKVVLGAAVLPDGNFGEGYSTTLPVSGGLPPYSWSITSGQLPTGASSGPNAFSIDQNGTITGFAQVAGTYPFQVTVSDSQSPPRKARKSFKIAVDPFPNPPPTPYQLTGPSATGGDPIASPHVAFVLVGNWWCTVAGSSTPACAGRVRPPHCTSATGARISCKKEAISILNALQSMVTVDYNDSSPGGYDSGIAGFALQNGGTIGPGLQLRTYNGAFFAGPVDPTPDPNTDNVLSQFPHGFGIDQQPDIANTVFVLLYAPDQSACNSSNVNRSGNGMTPQQPSHAGVYGDFPTASVWLEDYHNPVCDPPYQFPLNNDLNSPISNPVNTPGPFALTPAQFATFAVSHEIDETIVSPDTNTNASIGWRANGDQIADPCNTRNQYGDVGPDAYPYYNYTQDRQGTVVSAYVSPIDGLCFPSVGTSVPPR